MTRLFSLAIYATPYSSQASTSAYQFAQAVLNSGHKLHRVFFYMDGIHNANALVAPPQDELNLVEKWQELAQAHQIDMVVCIAAALRRGILDETEAKRYAKMFHNLAPTFSISGLGQLLEAAVTSDRLITFGA